MNTLKISYPIEGSDLLEHVKKKWADVTKYKLFDNREKTK